MNSNSDFSARLFVAAIAAGAALILTPSALRAETNVFTGDSGSSNSENWTVDNLWSLGHCPTGDDDVVIPTGKTVRVWSQAIAAKSITVVGSSAILQVGKYGYTLAPQTMVSVANELTVTDGAVFKIYAGEQTDLTVFKDAISNQTEATAALYAHPTVVSVGGTFTVSDDGIVYPYSAIISGTPVFFKAGNFVLAADGLIDVRNRGWFCRYQMSSGETVPEGAREEYNSSWHTYSFCFGYGSGTSYGPGYGGKAVKRKQITTINNNSITIEQPWWTGETYGSAYAPFLSGSMISGWGYTYSRAAGSIVVLATGTVTLAGTLNADGRATLNNDYDGEPNSTITAYGSPSGGGIWVCGRTVNLESSAVLTANGGDVQSDWRDGPGGGGRISIGFDLSSDDWDTLAATTNLPSGFSSSAIPTVTTSAKGGALNYGASDTKSEDGTITYVTKTAGKTTLTITNNTENIISENLECGTFTVSAIDELTYTIGSYGYDSTNPENVRYACAGWTLTNKDGTQEGFGQTPTAAFTLNEANGPYTLTWNWNNRETRHAVAANGPGTITVNGAAAGSGTSIWKANSGAGTDTLVATPNDGAVFVGWFGLPFGKATTATVTVPDATGANYVAVFAAATPSYADKTWIGGTDGSWDDPSSWDPIGVPTLSDDVKITSGTCWTPQGAVAHSIAISSGATFALAAAWDLKTSTVIESTGTSRANAYYLFVSNDFTCAGTAYFGAESVTCTNLWLEVGNDFSLTGTATAEVTARPCWAAEITTNALYEAATIFRIGGELSLAGTSKLEPRCDRFTGAAVRFECETLTVAEGATVSAQDWGWAWRAYTGDPDPRACFSGSDSGSANFETCAFSPGYTYALGGSHGGEGSYSFEAWLSSRVHPYGYALAPFLPGSPRGFSDGNATLGYGGGVVWIKCRAEAVVNGVLNASASSTWRHGSASGGSVWLLTTGLTAGPNAALKAEGQSSYYTSAGGGGRICLGIGLSEAEIAACANGETPAGVTVSENITLISASAAGGASNVSGGAGTNGTLRTLTGSLANVPVNVAGSPLQAIGPTTGYGSFSYPAGKKVTFVGTANGYGLDPSDPVNIRYACAGFEVRDLSNNLLTNGATSTLVYEIPHEEVTITWFWTTKQKGVTVYNPKGETFGTVLLNGESYPNGGTVWGGASDVATVEAVPASGYEFLYWMGEFPYGQAKQKKLTLSLSQIRHITPIFRLAEAPTTRVWTGAGERTGSSNMIGLWLDPASWSPANIPGLEDDVLLDDWPGVPCYATNNYIEVKSLTVEGCLWVGARPGYYGHRFSWGPDYYFSMVTPRTEEISVVVTGSLAVNAGGNCEMALGARDQQVHGHLTVGGDLSIASSAKLYVVGGVVTNDFTHASGTAAITVGGTLAVTNTALLSVWSEPRTGGSVCIRANKVLVGEGASISADCAGYHYSSDGKVAPETVGVGYGNSIGGGYGGHGATGTEPYYSDTYGLPYGNPLAPIHPGAGSGYMASQIQRGGGLVRIHAKEMSIYGSVTANALANDGWGWSGYCSASGGGIWLTADKFDFAATTLFSAYGGDSQSSRHAEGSGGRIAIGYRLTEGQIASLANGATHGVGHSGKLAEFLRDFPVLSESSVNVKGGIAYSQTVTNSAPEVTVGTFRYVTPAKGMTIIVK